jgi:hypothetical protein
MRLPVSKLVAPHLAEGCANVFRISSRAARVSSDESRVSGNTVYFLALATERGRHPRTRAGSPRYSQKSISMLSRLSPSPGGPDAPMASGLFEVVVGRVRSS